MLKPSSEKSVLKLFELIFGKSVLKPPSAILLYFKHICVVLVFQIFQENYISAAKGNDFGSSIFLTPWIRSI